MSSNYIPTREAELLTWSSNLASKLTITPEDYGLTEDQVAAYAAVQSAYAQAYSVANDPNTRNKPNIATKNEKKTELIAATRPLVQTLQAWSGMTDAKRDELQIPVRDTEPSPIGPPTEMPVLRVSAVNGRVVDLQVRREDGETKRKPIGARAVWLYSHTGPNPSTNLQDWKFEGGSTKHNPQVVFPDSIAAGTEVYLTALWVSPTDKPGPACGPVKTHINFVGLNQAA